MHLSEGMVSDHGLRFAHAGHSLGRAGGQSSLLLQPLLYFLNGPRQKQEVNMQLQILQASNVSCNLSKSQYYYYYYYYYHFSWINNKITYYLYSLLVLINYLNLKKMLNNSEINVLYVIIFIFFGLFLFYKAVYFVAFKCYFVILILFTYYNSIY